MSAARSRSSEATIASAAASAAVRRSAPARGALGNQATQAAIKAKAEARLGIAGEAVQIERETAAGVAGQLGARAATSGNRIVLGAQADNISLAHELIHVAQAQRFGAPGDVMVSARDDGSEREARRLAPELLSGSGPIAVTERPSATWQREEPAVVIVPVGGAAAPLAGYDGLRERLSAADWNALNAAARRRSETIATGVPPVQANEVVKTELSVPVQDLFQPLVEASKAAGGDQWLRDVYALSDAGDAGAMSWRIQDEILYGWMNSNFAVMSEPVTIGLVDPDAKAGGVGNILSFALRGRPVAPVNGLLTLAALDKAIGGSIDFTVARMTGELATLAKAIETAGTAKAMLSAAKDIAGQSHEKIAAQSLDQIDAAMRKGLGDLDRVSGSPFSDLVQPTKTALSAFIEGEFAAFIKADVAWRLANPRQKTDYERHSDELEKDLEEEKKNPSVFGKMFIVDRARLLGHQDMAFGGSLEQQRQLGHAYDQGLISYESWTAGVAKAERRGYIFAAVTGALTIATFGLGLYVAPVTLGGAVLFGAGTGLVLATGPMLASNLYTSTVDFADPTLQGWWKGGAYSGRDIAIAGLIGAGIGAALPIAGKVLGGLRGQGASALAALKAGAALPGGVVAQAVGKGVVELTIASEGVVIRVSEAGYQVIGRAGANAAAVLEEGAWPAELIGQGKMEARSQFALMHPRYPTSVMLGQRGWGVISPQSAAPVQFGLWPELALPAGGVAEPAATVSPLLLDAATGKPVTLIAGNDKAMVLASANIPQGIPKAPVPLMLGAGPTPFGLLPVPLPNFQYVGPMVPQSFEQSVTPKWGMQVAQRGSSMLPFVGEGGVWLRLPSGEWAAAYYPTRPGGIPNTSLITYGVDNPDFLVDAPGANRSALVQPRPGGSYKGDRVWPMLTSDMFDPATGMTHGRGHLVPHAATKPAGPGQTLSTADPRNFVAHPRKYNEWIRNQLEQMLKREGATFTAHDIVGANPRVTTGGYIIPEAEVWVQYGANGAPVRSWRFPLAANPAYYETLTGSFKDVLGQFEIRLTDVPTTPVRR